MELGLESLPTEQRRNLVIYKAPNGTCLNTPEGRGAGSFVFIEKRYRHIFVAYQFSLLSPRDP